MLTRRRIRASGCGFHDRFRNEEQLRWFKADGAQADTAYFTNPNNRAIAWRIDGTEFGDPASAIYVAYNGWSGDVNFTLPWPGKQRHRVTYTATWSEGLNAVAVPGFEAFIGGEGRAYGLPARSLLLLVANWQTLKKQVVKQSTGNVVASLVQRVLSTT